MQLNNKSIISIRQQPIEDMAELKILISTERASGNEVSYSFIRKIDGLFIFQIIVHKADAFLHKPRGH